VRGLIEKQSAEEARKNQIYEEEQMKKKVLIITGSPRRGGTSDRLAASFASGAIDAGHEVTTIHAATKKIGGCLGCNACMTGGGACVQNDDMTEILREYQAADVYVFATPIYFFNITAQIKLLIDRTYALLASGTPKDKKAALLFTLGDGGGKAVEPAQMMFDQIFDYLGIEEVGRVVCGGLEAPSDIDGRPELGEAYALGKSI
jgi:multimeric flavodoxin WrbA